MSHAAAVVMCGCGRPDVRVWGYGGQAMKRRPRGLYFHVIFGFPQRPWLELAVGVRRRGRLVTHHIEFPWPETHSEPYQP